MLILFFEEEITLFTTLMCGTVAFWVGDEFFCLDNCYLDWIIIAFCELDIKGVFCVIFIDWLEATLLGIKELETGVEGPTTTWLGLEVIVAWLACLCEIVTWVFTGTRGILEFETNFF